jgi:hypothetical protein
LIHRHFQFSFVMASRTNHELTIGIEMMDASRTAAERPKLGSRLGSSPKLLARKALERASEILGDGETLEASFPQMPEAEESALAAASSIEACGQQDGNGKAMVLLDAPTSVTNLMLSEPSGGGVATLPVPPVGQVPAPAPVWSDEDESALQALLTRRKAAGYQRRGRNVGAQLIAVGTITPNPKTVVAVIVAIVAAHGSIARAELLEEMATAIFPHAKAQPTDKSWCQGYVAGAVRNGFLTLSEQSASITEAV